MELLKELDGDYARLEELISAINRTNNSTQAGEGAALSDLLAKRSSKIFRRFSQYSSSSIIPAALRLSSRASWRWASGASPPSPP